MINAKLIIATVLTLLLTGCSSSHLTIPTNTVLPTTNDNYTIVWVGSGESYVYKDGRYQRSTSNDYAFEVVQRRYDNHWESIKNMHRIHPEYDGKAGEREQTMFFALEFLKEEHQIVSKISSSLGNGYGTTDSEFREQTIEFPLENISAFAPYNTMRITQHYKYEEGQLLETVELFKRKDGIDTPFVKIEEQAEIFRPEVLKNAPTVFK